MSKPHIEKHFAASDVVRDIVIGMSDGLTVPFALAAGLSGAVSVAHIILTAGAAEIAAGALAMGLGGYLAARSDRDHYRSELERERREVEVVPELEKEEVATVFREFGLKEDAIALILPQIMANPTKWVDFMMRFELGLEAPDPTRAVKSAFTIAGAYIAGGLIPLFPYMIINEVHRALSVSVVLTLISLFSFGAIKGRIIDGPRRWLRSGIQTLLVGGIAASAAFALARLLSE